MPRRDSGREMELPVPGRSGRTTDATLGHFLSASRGCVWGFRRREGSAYLEGHDLSQLHSDQRQPLAHRGHQLQELHRVPWVAVLVGVVRRIPADVQRCGPSLNVRPRMGKAGGVAWVPVAGRQHGHGTPLRASRRRGSCKAQDAAQPCRGFACRPLLR